MRKKIVNKYIAGMLCIIIVFCSVIGVLPGRQAEASTNDYYSPFDVAYSPDGTMMAVSDLTKGQLEIIATATGTVTKNVPLNGQPKGVVWLGNNRVYVAEYDARSVAEVDAIAGTVLRRFQTGPKPTGVAVTANKLVVSDSGLQKVSVVDIVSGSILGEVPVQEYPSFVEITTDGNYAIIGHATPVENAIQPTNSSPISIIDINNLTVTTTLSLPSGSSNVRDIKCSPDGNWAYVVHTLGRVTMPTTQITKGWVNTDALTIINVPQKSIYTTVLLDTLTEGAADPWGLAISADSNTLWISISGTHQVYRVDLQNLHQLLNGNIPGIGSYSTTFDSTSQYRIVNKRSSKCLDVPGSSTLNDIQIIQYADNGGNNQKWKILDAGSGYYYIQNVATGKYIDNKGSTAENAAVVQWSSSSSDNQKWTIVSVGGGYFKLVAKVGGKVFDNGDSPSNDAGMVQRTDNGSDGQRWQLVKNGENIIPTLFLRSKAAYSKPYADIWFDIKADTTKRALLKNNLGALWSAGLVKKIKLPGQGPRGIAISPNGQNLAVTAYFSGAIYVINTTTNAVIQTIAVGTNPADSAARRGERIFFDASTTTQKWLSCATCHPEGRADGLDWDMPNDGVGTPKNTKSMYRVFEVAPAMWRGVRADAAMGVRSGFKFIKFREPTQQELDDIGAYIQSFAEEVSPYRNVDGSMTADALAGKGIFESATTQCSSCHSGENYTDMQIHDVGTKDVYDVDGNYVTAPLGEMWRVAPYLHDGSAPTMRDVLTTKNAENRHGNTSQLTEQQLNQLEAYLLQLTAGTTMPDVQPPTAPSNLTYISKTETTVALQWTAATDNTAVTSYDVYNGNTFLASTPGLTYTVVGLTANTAYTFTIKAKDAANNISPASNDLVVTTNQSPYNVAINKTSSADSTETGNTTDKGNDGSTTTRWCAANGNLNHWWKVDLGGLHNLTGYEIMWEMQGKNYKYKIEGSSNNTTWVTLADKTTTTSTAQIQAGSFTVNNVRYVRITITGLATGSWASFFELKILGLPVPVTLGLPQNEEIELIAPTVIEDPTENITETLPDELKDNKTPEELPKTPEELPKTPPEELPKTTPPELPKTTPPELPKTPPEERPNTTPEDRPKTTPEDRPEKTPQGLPSAVLDDNQK